MRRSPHGTISITFGMHTFVSRARDYLVLSISLVRDAGS
jgi:hypothetical protein